MQQSRRPFLDTRLFARKGNIEEFVIHVQVGGESDKSSEEDRSSSDTDCSISDSET